MTDVCGKIEGKRPKKETSDEHYLENVIKTKAKTSNDTENNERGEEREKNEGRGTHGVKLRSRRGREGEREREDTHHTTLRKR